MFRLQKRNMIFITAVFLAVFLFYMPKADARSGCCSSHGGVCGCGCCDGSSLSATCAPYYPECSSRSNYNPPVKTYTPATPTTKNYTPSTNLNQSSVNEVSSSSPTASRNDSSGIDPHWYIFFGLLALFNGGSVINWLKDKFKK